MATIRIDDLAVPPVRALDGHSTGVAGGVYPIRSRSLERRSVRTRSVERRGVKLDDHDHEYGEEGTGLRQDGDFKQKQVRENRSLKKLLIWKLIRYPRSSGARCCSIWLIKALE